MCFDKLLNASQMTNKLSELQGNPELLSLLVEWSKTPNKVKKNKLRAEIDALLTLLRDNIAANLPFPVPPDTLEIGIAWQQGRPARFKSQVIDPAAFIELWAEGSETVGTATQTTSQGAQKYIVSSPEKGGICTFRVGIPLFSETPGENGAAMVFGMIWLVDNLPIPSTYPPPVLN